MPLRTRLTRVRCGTRQRSLEDGRAVIAKACRRAESHSHQHPLQMVGESFEPFDPLALGLQRQLSFERRLSWQELHKDRRFVP